MNNMQVVGNVQFMANGGAMVLLQPVAPAPAPAPPPQQGMHPPAIDTIFAELEAGTLQIHASRVPLTITDLKVAISNIQAALKLAKGPEGGHPPFRTYLVYLAPNSSARNFREGPQNNQQLPVYGVSQIPPEIDH